jgi:hypothetical protein
MADDDSKKSLKLKPHHRIGDLPKSSPKIGAAQSSKSPKPIPPSSSSYQIKPADAFKKTTGIDNSKKQTAYDVKPKSFSVKEEAKTSVKVKEVSGQAKKNSSPNKAKEKTVKKVYSLTGQKHDPPEERDPLRIFYQSLYEQIPTSEMATIWMMEHGLLPPEKAKKAYERKQRKQQQQKTGTPVKFPVSEKKRSVNGDSRDFTNSTKKRSLVYDNDDDFVSKAKKLKGIKTSKLRS